MKGNIYTSEKCRCGGKVEHDENNDNFKCVECGKPTIPKSMTVRFGAQVCKRFNKYRYANARQFLEGLRFKTSEGSFDVRDYQRDNPLGFEKQALKWLSTKKGLSKSYLNNLERWMNQAVNFIGPETNIKNIRFAMIEDFILSLELSSKTRHDIIACLSQFFAWVKRREGVDPPDMPEVKYKLGWRKIIDLETQALIIDEVGRICPNVRIWIGIKWLATYVAIRPAEMWSLKEGQIDVDGCFTLAPENTKEGELKLVPMTDEDIQIYRSLPRSFDHLPFFRRHKGRGVSRPGEQISIKAFYRWWVKARNNLGISGVDLYGGTRHSTVSAMGEYFTPEQIKKHATQHKTNKAFERYYRHEVTAKRTIYDKIEEVRKQKKVDQQLIR